MKSLVCVALFLGTFIPQLVFAAESLLYIQVRNTRLRSEPQFWSATTADLSYGATVVPLGAAPKDKAWLKVKSGATEGYLHVSAVTKKRIVLNSQTIPANRGVDSSSIVLAGKGFNNQVENRYRAANGLDYTVVDEVEKLAVSGQEEELFIAQGKLAS